MANGSAEARPRLAAERLQALHRHEVLVFTDPHARGLERGKAIGLLDVTPEEIVRVLSDFERWPEYLPRVSASHVLAKEGKTTLVETTLELPFPLGTTTVRAFYRFEQLPGGIYRVSFRMRDGDLRQYEGSLYIEPWDTPWKAYVTYEIVAEPKLLAASSTINRGVLHLAESFVHALRQRTNNLRRLGLLHPILPRPPRQKLSLPLDPNSVKAKLDTP